MATVTDCRTETSLALLLLDFHDIFVSMVAKKQEARESLISPVVELLEFARATNTPVLHCLIDVSAEPLSRSPILARWNSGIKHLIDSNPAIGLEPRELTNASTTPNQERTFMRRPGQVSALTSPGLLTFLHDELQVSRLILCGLTTSGCLLSTARHAADENFEVIVCEDGCRDMLPEIHDTVLSHILAPTASVVDFKTAKDMIGKL